MSDIHFRSNWPEEQGIVCDALFADLGKQVSKSSSLACIFTGDILQSGESAESYEHFSEYFIKRLELLGFGPHNTIFVPGNHDVDREYTRSKLHSLLGLRDQPLTESTFNDAMRSEIYELLYPKFEKYLNWQERHTHLSLRESFYGRGFTIFDTFGVYCLNTALFSFGGLENPNTDEDIQDEGHLPVETRSLHEWLQTTTHEYRILAMHHPPHLLNTWASQEISKLVEANFDLVLCGHEHENRTYHTEGLSGAYVECIAPPLFTRKSDKLGYSILEVCANPPSVLLKYRHWVRSNFVTGAALSGTDDGQVRFGAYRSAEKEVVEDTDSLRIRILQKLRHDLNVSLKCYSSLPPIWVSRTVADQPERAAAGVAAVMMSADTLADSLRDCVIKAPPQFGLSALGRYIALRSWELRPGQFVLVLDAHTCESHETAITSHVLRSVSEQGLTIDDLAAIVLDGASVDRDRLINNIKKIFPSVPLVLLCSIKHSDYLERSLKSALKFNPAELYLWQLDRAQIRELVRKFIESGYRLAENQAVSHLTADLETLNLHRSPLTCITLLRVYERQIDFSPANRTEMLERFLFLIFADYRKKPDYSNFPDMKDSLYVLGYFCEKLIRSGVYSFSRDTFVRETLEYCKKMVIDIDCSRLFAVLAEEKIILERDRAYVFRYSSWIYFFSAHRMHHNNDFRDFILSGRRYINFPEMIEFYSGIDRRRGELVERLRDDLSSLTQAFEGRSEISRTFDPYDGPKWIPSQTEVAMLEQKIETEIETTNLPETVKDGILDKRYDRTQPYNQVIRNFANDSSLRECCFLLRGAARALRNSDFVAPEIKMSVLEEVLRAWAKLFQTIALLSPLFAQEEYIEFENLKYRLVYDGEASVEELFVGIVESLPHNIVSYFEFDLASSRIRPLLEKYMRKSSLPNAPARGIERCIVATVLLRQKPEGWYPVVRDYALSLDKDSLYLKTLLAEALHEYRYGFCTHFQKQEIEDLMGVVMAKHQLGKKRPGKKLSREVGKQFVLKNVDREL